MVRLLPIGSIVIIDLDKNEKIMILGRLVKKTDDDEKVWDYCGCLAPYGLQKPDGFRIFNHSQIKKLLFVGFQDEEELQYAYSAGLKKESEENEK